jgi:hypothetical protein
MYVRQLTIHADEKGDVTQVDAEIIETGTLTFGVESSPTKRSTRRSLAAVDLPTEAREAAVDLVDGFLSDLEDHAAKLAATEAAAAAARATTAQDEADRLRELAEEE